MPRPVPTTAAAQLEALLPDLLRLARHLLRDRRSVMSLAELGDHLPDHLPDPVADSALPARRALRAHLGLPPGAPVSFLLD